MVKVIICRTIFFANLKPQTISVRVRIIYKTLSDLFLMDI